MKPGQVRTFNGVEVTVVDRPNQAFTWFQGKVVQDIVEDKGTMWLIVGPVLDTGRKLRIPESTTFFIPQENWSDDVTVAVGLRDIVNRLVWFEAARDGDEVVFRGVRMSRENPSSDDSTPNTQSGEGEAA